MRATVKKGLIPCMNCGQKFFTTWNWYTCDTCGFKICASCIGSHHNQGIYGGGKKCSRCQHGRLHRD